MHTHFLKMNAIIQTETLKNGEEIRRVKRVIKLVIELKEILYGTLLFSFGDAFYKESPTKRDIEIHKRIIYTNSGA